MDCRKAQHGRLFGPRRASRGQIMVRMSFGVLVHFLRRAGVLAACALLPAAAWSQSSSLTLGNSSELVRFGPRLQARIGINSSQSTDGNNAAWQQQGGVLLGDYYFSRARLGLGDVSGGFRATSGLLLGQRSLALGTPALAAGQSINLTVLRQQRLAQPMGETMSEGWSTVPYLGVGWSGGSVRGGWGLTADFGFAARGNSNGLRLGNTQTLDEVLRELRITPVLQLGVSYAF
jgi:hypothetical protein